jgi:hypothetical protein
LEIYLNNLDLFIKSTGVQFEVVLGRPLVLMRLQGCLRIAEKEKCLKGKQNESNPEFPFSVPVWPYSTSFI